MSDELDLPPTGFDWETEDYRPTDRQPFASIAQEVFDRGLVFLVNQNVLHHYGYALGVTTDDDGQVIGLSLHRSSDPDGIWFDEETIVVGREKLAKAGYR